MGEDSADGTARSADRDADSSVPRSDAESGSDADSESDVDSAGVAGSATPAESENEDTPSDGTGPRSVVVPSRVYKSVTVFSTLFAVVTVVGGFVVLDAATKRASVSLSEADPVLALVGLGLIALGAVTYAFSTRFKAAGMGNAKEDTGERSDNG